MEEKRHDEHEFDPDFSEYNPIFSELKDIKQELSGKKMGFFAKLKDKLSFRLLIQLD